MNKSRLLGVLCAEILSVITLPSYAALIGVLPTTPGGTDYQAYYDNVADMTWLQDANAGAGSAFDDGFSTTDGEMTWDNATAWAAGLNVNGITGWRLPNTLLPDVSCDTQSGGFFYWGFNCTGSEMGNLFYSVLGNTSWSLSNTGPFSNVLGAFWSTTDYYIPTNSVYSFNMFNGHQFGKSKTSNTIAWAVQSGNAGASAVPVPSAFWLFGSGLLGLVGVARRKL